MRRLVISIFILLLFSVAWTGCSSARKNDSELRGLMLLDNTKLDRNRAYYSKHNVKTKTTAFRKYHRYRRHLR